MNPRRVQFTKAKIKKIIDLWKNKNIKPSYAEKIEVKSGVLYINDLEVVPKEDIDTWLRKRLYNKSLPPYSLSRQSGYKDHVATETLGISRRAWYDFLSKQDVHQKFSARPKTVKLPGRRINSFGHVEIDLIEVKHKDVPSRSTDTYIFTMVDRLSNYLVAKRVDTKQVSPKTKRGTLVVFKELLEKMNSVLPTKVHTLYSDAGSEFMGELAQFLKKQKIRKVIVSLGATIESKNGDLQRKLYKLINMKRKGGLDKLLVEAVRLCNQTTSRITKKRPIDAVKHSQKEISENFNKARQRPGKQIGQKIKRGDSVRIMDSKAIKKKGAFYKSYRPHWSGVKTVQKIQGLGVLVDGQSYPRSRIKKVPKLDKQSVSLLEEPKKLYKKKKKVAPVLRKRSTRAGAAQAKSRMKGMR